MLTTTHVLASIVISQHTPNPFWAFLIALISHYILDLIPHGDEYIHNWIKAGPFRKRVFYFLLIDLGILTVFLITVYLKAQLPNPKTLIFAIIGGTLPDIIFVSHGFIYQKYIIRKQRKKWRSLFRKYLKIEHLLRNHEKFHEFLHSVLHLKASLEYGIVIQLFFITLFLLLTFWISRPF